MKEPRVVLQIALAFSSIVAVVTVGWETLNAPLWAVIACVVSALAWVVRACVALRVGRVADAGLLAVMLVGSTLSSGPTYGISLYPAAGSLVIILGLSTTGRRMVWVWPTLAVASATVGFFFGPRETWLIATTAATIGIAFVAGRSRRAQTLAVERRFRGLDRAYAAELTRIQASVDRILTVDTLRKRFPSLTPREAEVLALICRGRSNDEVAGELFITVATVKGHVNSIFAKLPARDRAQAIAFVLGTAARDVSVVTP